MRRKSEIALGSEDITPDAMRTLLRYLYTDELSVGGEQNDDVTALMEVIVAANEMLAEGLKYVYRCGNISSVLNDL